MQLMLDILFCMMIYKMQKSFWGNAKSFFAFADDILHYKTTIPL